MTDHRAPHVWPALQAHDPRAVIDFLVAVGFEESYVVTADVGSVLRRAQAAGIGSPGSPTEQDYGSREVTLRDPEGNQWTFGTYPGEPRTGASA
ncbi:MAG: hypothetical protein WA991_03535 [Ornithinimicrobium sp.]